MARYRNKKSSAVYTLVDDDVLNASNGSADERMVLYTNDAGKRFVRNYAEFQEKFSLIETKVISASPEEKAGRF